MNVCETVEAVETEARIAELENRLNELEPKGRETEM